MTTTRRQFLTYSLATGAVASLGLPGCSSPPRPSAVPEEAKKAAEKSPGKRILILGGTGFLGPALIDAVLARGHWLSLFNSGRTEERRKAAGRPSVIPDGVEVLTGNRDPEKTANDRRLARDPDAESARDPNSPRGLTRLEGKSWDAVIDTSGYFPRMVRASAGLLAKSVGQYVFISSISVYKNMDKIGLDETGELHGLADPTTEEFGPKFENYGGGKALCEAAAEAAMPGRVTNIRPGFIVGPRDTSRRWLYWPWRSAQGGDMLAPGTPDDPIQLIDVRDLAEWIVHCIENATFGVFNATGPEKPLTMQAMLAACRAASGSDARVTFADPKFLEKHEIELPIWAPTTGENAGIHRVAIDRALGAGLRFRSVDTTARDTLEWHRSLPAKLQKAILPPSPTLEREGEVLELWRKHKSGA